MQQNNPKNSRDTYRTGSTNPPKSHLGIITALLILVTVLCSIVTVLGMMNIRLHLLLQDSWQQEPATPNQGELALAEAEGQLVFSEDSYPIWGLTCQPIDTFYRSYNGWPDGLYISQVTPGSAAHREDIRPGDIVVAVNGAPICLTEQWEQTMDAIAPGQSVTLTLYREETEFTVTLTKE